MKLIVHELSTSLYQPMRPTKNIEVGAVRPHLYLHNSPSGSVKMQIATADGTVLAESNTIAFSTINASPYFHGYVRFDISANLKKDTVYRFYLVATGGYSFSESAYCGWCNDYDLRKYNRETPITFSAQAALDLEIWSLSRK